ncbi:MAG: hypothetical protein ACR2NN_10715 [Bryobacteraceae bacterium]
MTNEQLYLAIGLPIIFNLIFNGVLFLGLNSRMSGLETRMSNLERFTGAKFDLLTGAIHELDNRLSRVEERFERR